MMLLNDVYDNYLLLTITVLVILPVLLALSTFFFSSYKLEIYSYSLLYFDNGYLGFQILSFFQYGVFVVMLILYPIYPSMLSLKKFLVNRNPESAIIEYELLKKTIYILFPFFIFGFAYLVGGTIEGNPFEIVIKTIGDPILSNLVLSIIGTIFFIVGSALLKIILLIVRKDFRFYFAKTLFRVISKKDESEKIEYFVKALNSYNKYIRRTLALEIKELKKIYSRVLSDPNTDKNHSIEKLSEAFEDRDKFQIIKCLSILFKGADTEDFLAKEPIGKKLEDWATILGTMVSTVAAIIGVIAFFI
jgi:hypothetical protein